VLASSVVFDQRILFFFFQKYISRFQTTYFGELNKLTAIVEKQKKYSLQILEAKIQKGFGSKWDFRFSD
jgi:hypothetical protein